MLASRRSGQTAGSTVSLRETLISAGLKPELAEPLMLYEVEGKSYPQIAEMLGVPIGTVRTRIFRAREFIAKRLEPVLGSQRNRRW